MEHRDFRSWVLYGSGKFGVCKGTGVDMELPAEVQFGIATTTHLLTLAQ